MPHREVVDGVLVIFGGAFLITPGFITDIVGLILLIPPTRAVVRRVVVRRLGAGSPRRAPRDAGRTTTWRARHASTTTRPGGSSGERPALSLSFFDPAHELYGTARSGATILFEGRKPRRSPRGPTIERDRRAAGAPSSADTLSLELEPVSARGGPGRRRARACAACAARPPARRWTASGPSPRPTVPPRWEELDAVRSISALVDERHALLALARRPRGARGPRRRGGDRLPARGGSSARRGGRPHLDRLRRRRPPAQRRASSCGSRARTSRGAGPGS